MNEQSKACRRRSRDPIFASTYFVGDGLDVGAGADGMSKSAHLFPKITSVREWDKADGDAQFLDGVDDDSYDWLSSSHCLEHLDMPYQAFYNWVRAVRPGGHLIITVPDWQLYEHGCWPSRFSGEHRWRFCMTSAAICGQATGGGPRKPQLIAVTDLLASVANESDTVREIELERLVLIRDYHNPRERGDQTLMSEAECAIEFVLRRI